MPSAKNPRNFESGDQKGRVVPSVPASGCGARTFSGRSQIRVDAAMHTSVEGVFACGDIVTYESKYKLLITAASEGAIAANAAYLYVRKPGRLTMTDLYT